MTLAIDNNYYASSIILLTMTHGWQLIFLLNEAYFRRYHAQIDSITSLYPECH